MADPCKQALARPLGRARALQDTYRAALFLAGRLPDFALVPLPPALLLSAAGGPGGGWRVRGFLQVRRRPGPGLGPAALVPPTAGAAACCVARACLPCPTPAAAAAQFHPDGTPQWAHRTSPDAKMDPDSDDAKGATHLALPSCSYFDAHGWHPENSTWLRVHGPLPCSGLSLASLHAQAARPDCGGYSWRVAAGEQPLPVLAIPGRSRLASGLAAGEAAFRLLRSARAADPQLF